MASVNKAIVLGNLGRDPELRTMPDGNAICNMSVATTYGWKDKASGEKKEETEWHRVTLRNRLAEIAGEYLKKGSSVYIEGRLRTRKWTDKDGIDKFTTEIVADMMQLLGGRAERQDGDRPAPASRPAQAARPSSAPTPGADPFGDMPDDLPF